MKDLKKYHKCFGLKKIEWNNERIVEYLSIILNYLRYLWKIKKYWIFKKLLKHKDIYFSELWREVSLS
ncbi:unnamed protein product [Blepharisma stoltei]|uniref:Uncharacterized protein n=1 Tax=Blepharisma stoltei TaxID=1481888 RepID=A0AAU9ID74_9CILI|nr:unnamed protein product [Blepharisma stoltei]